jgi:hypothetical protein
MDARIDQTTRLNQKSKNENGMRLR